MTKARLQIEFLNVGMTNPLITQMLLSDKFFMNTKFVDLIELYKLGFHKKIVTQKQLGDQGVCHTDIEKFYWRTHFSRLSYHLRCNDFEPYDTITLRYYRYVLYVLHMRRHVM